MDALAILLTTRATDFVVIFLAIITAGPVAVIIGRRIDKEIVRRSRES